MHSDVKNIRQMCELPDVPSNMVIAEDSNRWSPHSWRMPRKCWEQFLTNLGFFFLTSFFFFAFLSLMWILLIFINHNFGLQQNFELLNLNYDVLKQASLSLKPPLKLKIVCHVEELVLTGEEKGGSMWACYLL